MAKKTKAPSPAPKKSKTVDNTLGCAMGVPGIGIGGGINPIGFPGNQGSPYGQPVEQATPLFNNLRWYLVSNMRQLLSELYVENGLVQTIVDVPVDDGLRGGIQIKSKQLDEGQIEELQISIDRDDDLATAGQAAKWNRLFGGAGILILTDQDPEEPLDLEALGPDDKLEFRAVDMWELFWDKQNTEGYDPAIQSEDFEFYNYYASKVHKSRVMRLKGFTAPSFIRPRLRGWGFSVVEVLVRSLNQYLKATDLGYEVLDEFKLDVYKIKNLVNTLLSPNGAQQVAQRMQTANYIKNYQNAIVMDSEDDFDHKQLSFSGLAEAMSGIRMQVASDMRMPIIKLFGQSVSSGLGNSAQEEMENYNSMVEAQVRNKLKYDLLRMCEIKCQMLFGFIPDDLTIEFKPLRELTAEQAENVKTQKFARLLQAKQVGELSTLEFRDACNKGNLFDVTLDTSEDLLNPDDPEVTAIVKEGGQAKPPAESKDIDDPGANREDTRKPRAWDKGAAPKEPVNPATKKNAERSKEDIQQEIDELLDKAEYMDDKNRHQDAERCREKARALEKLKSKMKNSLAYDKAAYEVDAMEGGDAAFDDRRKDFFENPKDPSLYERACEASQKLYGQKNEGFILWWYKKEGGKF